MFPGNAARETQDGKQKANFAASVPRMKVYLAGLSSNCCSNKEGTFHYRPIKRFAKKENRPIKQSEQGKHSGPIKMQKSTFFFQQLSAINHELFAASSLHFAEI